MKILPILCSPYSTLLMEANLINGKDPYHGVSLEKFVTSATANLASPQAIQMFTKKISRLLMTDERFMYAVRELPPNAPDWAKVAFEKGDLVFFNPSAELTDNVENIAHYVAALEQDMQSTDNNVKANDTREMQGFVKVETLDLLVQKTNEYFAQGSKKQESTDTEGMQKVLEAPGGFVWYVLVSPVAFFREGKTLKNCIGRNYTAENTKATNTKIYVLRDSNNKSVVATRIKESEMQEVKGSNNQPPIPRYMPAVQKLINTFNITLGPGGHSDVGQSGYYFHEGVLYSRSQAIAKLIKLHKLFDIPGTDMAVSRVVSQSETLLNHLYITPARNQHYIRYYDNSSEIYEVRAKDGTPVATFIVTEKRVEAILRYTTSSAVQEAEEHVAEKLNSRRIIPTAIEMLARQELIRGVSRSMQRELVLNYGAAWNDKTRTFSYHEPDRQHKTSAKGTHELEVYTGKQAIELVKALYPDSTPQSDIDDTAKNVKAVYAAVVRKATDDINRSTDKVLVVVEDNKGNLSLFSVRGRSVDMSAAGFTRVGARWSSEFVRDGKTVNTLVALANEQGLRLPTRFVIGHGLGQPNGQYGPLKALDPVEVPGDPSAVVFDLRELDPFDKVTVMIRAISTDDTKPHMTPFSKTVKFDATSTYLIQKLVPEDKDLDVKATEETLDKWSREVFGAPVTAIYRVNIVYGAANQGGKVTLIASGNEIRHIDSETLKHTWQSRDDYAKVSDQLNKFASTRGLKFSKSATSKSPQLRVKDGKVIPAELLAKTKLESRLKREKDTAGRTAVMTFADGFTAKKMNEADYGIWTAHGIKKAPHGMPWEIADADGNVQAIILVTRGGDVNSMYSTVEGNNPPRNASIDVSGRQLPTLPSVNVGLLKYVKRMAQEFNWTGVGDQFIISGKDQYGKMLLRASRRTNRTISMYREYIRNEENPDQSQYVDSRDIIKYGYPLVATGMLSIEPTNPRESYRYLRLTPKGADALNRVRRGETINLAAYSQMTDLHADYQRPPEPAPVHQERGEATPRAPRQRAEGGGSKADLALERFREMVQANNGEMPSRSDFIRVLTQPPFNMTPAGASTYQYNTKAKYLRDRGEINESFSFVEFLTQIL